MRLEEMYGFIEEARDTFKKGFVDKLITRDYSQEDVIAHTDATRNFYGRCETDFEHETLRENLNEIMVEALYN
jgi:hypothetical protein